MTFDKKKLSLVLAAALVGLPAAGAAAQDAPGGAPGGPPGEGQQLPPAPDPAETDRFEAIMAEMQTVQMQIAPALSEPDALTDAKKREENRETVVPALKRMIELLDEAADAAPVPAIGEQIKQQRPQMQALLVAFDDEDAKKELESAEDDNSKAALLLGRILKAEETQERVDLVKKVGEAARESEEDAPYGQVAFAAMSLFSDEEEIRTAARDVIENDLEGEAAEMMKAQLSQVDEAEQEMQAFKDKFKDKPLKIEGRTLDGSEFTSEEYKGKVVLVDFWATWCGPCIAELPALKETYEEYHDQGFEIIGVSSDNSEEELRGFLQENPEMSWVQLFNPEQPGWHPIATELGITGIPTVFLLDRKGNVRDVVVGSGEEAEKMREMIPDLLEEKAGENQEGGVANDSQ